MVVPYINRCINKNYFFMNSRLALISEVFAISEGTIHNYITQFNNYIIPHLSGNSLAVVTKQIIDNTFHVRKANNK